MPRRHSTRDARLAAARAGDEAAIAALVRAMWPTLWRSALAVSGSPEAAEDAVQEALGAGFGELDRFDETERLHAWLRRAAVHRAIDLQRSERARAEREHVAASSAPAGTDEGSGTYSWVSHDEDLMVACRRLPEGARHVLLLHFWADMELGDIADVLELPVGTVKSRLARGLARLRDDLQEADDDQD